MVTKPGSDKGRWSMKSRTHDERGKGENTELEGLGWRISWSFQRSWSASMIEKERVHVRYEQDLFMSMGLCLNVGR